MATPAPEHDVDVRGHCYCGAIAFRVRIPAGDEPIFTAYCHCDSCRRAHAAPLYHVACIEEPWFEFTSGEEHLREFTKPGGSILRAFCDQCGSKILNRFGRWRPDGKVPLAFFPNLLEAEAQRALPHVLRPAMHNFRQETVLDEALLRGFFDHA